MPINAIIDHVQNVAQKILPTLTLGEKHGIKSPAFKNRSIPGTINRLVKITEIMGNQIRDFDS